ncbi:cyclic nucleotide-binding domain-containing protein [uncultured Pseudodesulfovibrio sp.]|uniref:Crp/Fnr family transcriptional regulator n=1 Tax=uncultured Pseudodesulfovibrio sp. TaxID=2035858 RepID=UPI0029C9373C|nr:cyclic nucleotide-binding domain-containing protein [uncultured Pseudodesulfovibrio sp.]
MKIIPFDPNDTDLVASILAIPAFRPLGGDRLADVMKMALIHDYEKREEVITQGETDQRMFFLMSGKLSVRVDDIEINTLDKPNTVFGEMGVIDTAPRSATIMTRRPSRCLSLDISFMDRLEGRAKLAVQAFFYKMFYEILSERLRETNEHIADLDMQKMVLETMDID